MKYRKRPVVIDAFQLTDDVLLEHFAKEKPLPWGLQAAGHFHLERREVYSAHVAIHTLEGKMTAMRGDWIIQGVAGELYPCKPDIFAATYEPVEAP